MTMTLTPLKDIPLVLTGEDLAGIILEALNTEGIRLKEGDILVLTQKIVSKAEGRWVNLAEVIPSARARELAEQIDKDARLVELILSESNEVLRTRPGTIIVEHRLGFVCANAGIDHSNVAGDGSLEEEWVLLLPEDPDKSAQALRERLEKSSGARIGVMIIDSHGRAWRLGVIGTVVGLAGMPGLVDLRGKPDLFGYTLRITLVAAADELAAAASLVMGQAAEGTPVVHVRGFPYGLREGSMKELLRPKEQDMSR
jgi:coenzyme F420-0:L-glutamate ligase/coenzyme F420-1:gamma-L-glutamate ligase